MTIFILIRHAAHKLANGVLAGRTPGVYLSVQGQEQAQQLVDRLAALPIDAIYSSPLERTMQTAQVLGAYFNLPVQTSDGFAEIDFGEWSGKSFDELTTDARWQMWNSFRSSAPLPNGGLMLAVQLRAVAALQSLCLHYPNQLIAIISHSDVIKAIVAHYLGIPLDLFQRIEISPASVSIIAVEQWGARVIRLNDTGELHTV